METASPPPGKVRLLDPVVAERIAAGEVIERPASVVKELVENSVDAGASEIHVALEDGGKSLIEVLDNGTGMSAEDLALCIERHATSKLSSLDDLERIATLGFRGEALPSIGAVSEMSILSRAIESPSAHEIQITLHGRRSGPTPATFGHFIDKPHGTRIQARGLFSQVPARLKFLKSQAAEVSQVREWIERIALAHPGVSFKLTSEGRSILNLRSGSEEARVRSILGDDQDFPLATVSNLQDGVHDRGLRIRAHWLQGLSQGQARRLVQVVNGRAVKDRLLQQALLSPFRQLLLPGQFPAVALFIEIHPGALDVNVHPTKTEVRFLESRKVFHEVQSTIERLIERSGAAGFAASSQPSSGFFRATSPTPSSGFFPPSHSPEFSFLPGQSPGESEPGGPRFFGASEPPLASGLESASSDTARPLEGASFSGFLFQTYLLFEKGNELLLVDQHAAHERIRYEKLRKAYEVRDGSGEKPRITPQALLVPEAVRFALEARPIIEPLLPALNHAGFEAELFGEDTLLFRSVPSEWGNTDLRTRLKNIVDRISDPGQNPSPTPLSNLLVDERLFETLASEACHSAVRAGDRLEKSEAQALVADLFRCEHPWNCPHGRPTLVRVPRARMEEWFQRRV